MVLVDTFVYPQRNLVHVQDGLRVAGVQQVVEVWCDVPIELAWQRYLARQRHPVHPQGPAIKEHWWSSATAFAPMALGPVIRVDTSVPVDLPAVVAAVRTALAS